jgi:Putative bacterial sensory transduction regulator
MDETDWFRSHVERCLQDAWGEARVVADGDGNYPFRYGPAACFVGITFGEVPTFARVWALAVVDVKKSAKLLGELNEINARTLTARAYWADGSIVVEQMLIAEAVSVESLEQACEAVRAVADNVGVLIAGAFDGRTPFDASVVLDEAATES